MNKFRNPLDLSMGRFNENTIDLWIFGLVAGGVLVGLGTMYYINTRDPFWKRWGLLSGTAIVGNYLIRISLSYLLGTEIVLSENFSLTTLAWPPQDLLGMTAGNFIVGALGRFYKQNRRTHEEEAHRQAEVIYNRYVQRFGQPPQMESFLEESPNGEQESPQPKGFRKVVLD